MKKAKCHPDRPYRSKDLCVQCYAQQAHKKQYADPIKRQRAAERSRKWDKANPERAKHNAKVKNLRKYGLTLEEYARMVAVQRNLCAICGKAERLNRALAIDHCHKTGKVRGLLCFKCNTAIGVVEAVEQGLSKIEGYLKTNG